MVQLKEDTVTYSKYIDSKVKWIDRIPANWEEYPFSSIAFPISIINKPNKELLSVYLDKGVIRFSDVTDKRTNGTSEDLSKYQMVSPGNLVLNNQQAWRGSVGVSKFDGIVSPAYIVLQLKDNIDHNFANYLFRDSSMVAHYLVCSKGVGTIQRNLYWPQLKRCYVPLPPLPEQTAIASFLDKKTALIDQAIEIKQKQIELLKERKQILIQKAVTRGLNPNVKMKDSCVEWLGVIPEHWEFKKMKYLFRDVSIKNKPEAELLSVTQDQGVVPRSIVENRMVMPNGALQTFKYISKGDFAISLRSFEGGLEYCYYSGIISPAYTVLKPTIKIHDNYYKYLFKCSGFISELQTSIVGIREGKNISYDQLQHSILPIPPYKEQEEISSFVDKINNLIGGSIEIKIREIDKLKEYKGTLINSAVTGKIKVF